MRLFTLLNTLILIPATLLAQGNTQSSSSTSQKEKEHPTRTLRVMLVGTRPLPAFETRGSKIVEVDPPLSKMPPTSFEFANPRHAPKIKEKGKPTARKISYSAWANELVTIKKYKGPELLQLHLKRKIISTTDFQKVECHLGESLTPFIVVGPSQSKAGWEKPVAEVINWDPVKHPANSVVFLNRTKLAIKVRFINQSAVIAPGKHKHFKVKLSKNQTFRYEVDASNGKRRIVVSNSQYRLNKNSRLIMLALPGIPTKSNKFPRPSLRMIPDTL